MATARFIDRIVQFPGRVLAKNVLTGDEETLDLVRAEGDIIAPGTLLNAANLNQKTQMDLDVQDMFDPVLKNTFSIYANDMSNNFSFLFISEETIQKYKDIGMADPRT